MSGGRCAAGDAGATVAVMRSMADEKHEPPEISPENREAEKAEDEHEPVQKVSSQPTGAKRDSYFKKRDYDE